ncbi:hypothetical protein B4U45_28285 [Mycobacterium persicum]|uniref:Uncharacterized protein n=1 Tax=Mycobacterium persicum TaxID=1487726 RepID=A0A8E2LKJ8_9MYCO|nr:hypothetical protein [Mycobacterium persicum]KZS85650.1 hypothetical protein A4G31_10495 [Mycobacterium persicum]ORB95072.1 hypothetical protein B1T44_11775 [Mycobacterium persicum]ORB98864.1 hypothetical protein B4U45_28285 [Mycobacterium persicum]VAZ79970.1 hypothetical protein LAUMK15_05154 [Mycobacterium persicum]VBA29810.1 hypothetical protein LAUMK4_04852 [Mycobacterium persicum]
MSVNRANTKSVKCANILAAIRDIDLALRSGQALPITRERLEELNFQILAGIPDAPEVITGKLREHNITAGKYLAPCWQDVPDLVDRFVQWLVRVAFRCKPGVAGA